MRYTAEIHGRDQAFDVAQVREKLEKYFVRKVATYRIKAAAQKGLSGLLVFNTDLPANNLMGVFNDLKAENSSIQDVVLRLGWNVPEFFEDMVQIAEDEKDPHHCLANDVPGEKDFYTNSFLDWVVYVVFLIAGIIFLVNGFHQISGLFIGFLFLGTCMYSLFNVPVFVHLADDGVELVYVLKHRQKILWQEIRSLETIFGRGEWCVLETSNGKIKFPVSVAHEALKKMIVRKSQLYFVDGFIYMRSNIVWRISSPKTKSD